MCRHSVAGDGLFSLQISPCVWRITNFPQNQQFATHKFREQRLHAGDTTAGPNKSPDFSTLSEFLFRDSFRLFWRWKSEAGRRPIPAELQQLIRRMARDNASWGEERIANELLLKLGPAFIMPSRLLSSIVPL
jgi:hypothetical protein